MKTVKLNEETHTALKIRSAIMHKPIEKIIDEMLREGLKNGKA